MIKIIVKTNTIRKERIMDIEDSPSKVFDDLSISPIGSVVNLNGSILISSSINDSFKLLGVEDGSTVNLNCVVKADAGI